MAWSWRYLDDDGKEQDVADGDHTFGTQADAETWLGQHWKDLAGQGVRAVSLYEDGRAVYGPMSLDPSA